MERFIRKSLALSEFGGMVGEGEDIRMMARN